MKKVLLNGRMPYSVVIALTLAAYVYGEMTHAVGPTKQACGIAVADQSAVVLDAVLNHPEMSKDQMKASISAPIRGVMQQYQALGYTVIDVSRNDQGQMTVTEVPSNAVDITNELRKAVNLPPVALTSTQQTAKATPASGAKNE